MRIALKKRNFGAEIFIDVCQDFDRVWTEGYLGFALPAHCTRLLQSYLTDRIFWVKYAEADLQPIQLRQESQRAVYLVSKCTCVYGRLIQPENVIMVTSADDSIVLNLHFYYKLGN